VKRSVGHKEKNMNDNNLPNDLEIFLRSGKQFDYDAEATETGEIELKSLSEIEPGVVWVNSKVSPLNDDAPHAGETGYYEVPAISLTNKCENYDPEFLLLWLPNEKLYGAWDSDDWYLYVFPGKTWTDIVNDPRTYINAMWFDFDRKVSAYFKPYPNYQYIRGRPFLKIAQRSSEG
jgi:hypothetical protein